MTLAELGQLLRAEREKRQLSVDDVADGLKISSRVLRALEAGDDTSLPHAVYVRGFISAYGKFLGLDVQELLNAVVLQEGEQSSSKAVAYENMVSSRAPQKKSMAPFLLIICLLLAGAGAAAWFYKDADIFAFLKDTPLHVAEPAPALPSADKEEAKTPVASTPVPKAQKTASDTQSSVVTAEKSASDTKKNTKVTPEPKEADAQKAPPVVKETAKAPQEQATKQTEPHVGSHKVIITALMTTWIHSSADNAAKRQFSLNPGDTFALTFEDSLSLTLGNAGGVRIHYNGKEMSALGREGEEKTVVFPPQM